LLLAFLCILLSLSTLAQPLIDGWLKIETDHFIVLFQLTEEETDYLNEYLKGFVKTAGMMEKYLLEVESFLGVDYDPKEHGKVYIFMYPSLETYQEAAGCLICAAHVGGVLPVKEKDDHENINPIAVYVNLDNSEFVFLHELAHIVDFSVIKSHPPPLFYEGLASYVGYKLDGISDERQFGLINQHLKLYLQEYGFSLLSYLYKYWKFSYQIGTSFIEFLVRRGGIKTFMSFYAELTRPTEESLNRLFISYWGQSLRELEAAWKEELAKEPITEEAKAAYEFRMDQIVIRYMFLGALAKDKELLRETFESLWIKGRFNRKAADFMRQYLSNPENFLVTREALTKVMGYLNQLISYVRTYHDDHQQEITLRREISKFIQAYHRGHYQKCLSIYLQLIHEYITWR
jgi:hypothetical protein